MSEAKEQSYYEIALTNRQVMSIFIVLLVCLLASFVSGVWIGRQGAGVRVQTADSQRIDGEAGSGEAPLGEMDFFSPRQPAQPPVATRPAAAAEPSGDGAEVTLPPAATPSRPPAGEPAATTTAAPAPPPAAAEAGEFLYIQVFSSIDREQAQSIVERLRGDGYAAFLSSVEVESRLMHRVRIGPYSRREEAEAVADQVQREHTLSTWITP